MAIKKAKKPAKAIQPKGRSRAMSEDETQENAEETQQENGAEQEAQQAPAAPPPALPPAPVSPQGSGAALPTAGTTEKGAPTAISQDQQFVLLLAAIMYTKPGAHGVRDAYQSAKNLVQALRDDEAAAAAAADSPTN